MLQGSVLGPILWNIAFDSMLELAEGVENCEIICYADDILIVVTGLDILHIRCKAGMFITKMINFIKKLGLEVAMNKTEAILFHPKRAKNLPEWNRGEYLG